MNNCIQISFNFLLYFLIVIHASLNVHEKNIGCFLYKGSGSRSRGHHRGGKSRGNEKEKYTEDFDFEQSNAKFHKEEIEKELLKALNQVHINDNCQQVRKHSKSLIFWKLLAKITHLSAGMTLSPPEAMLIK